MTRHNVIEKVAGRRIRLVTAHPDDSIWYTSLIAGSAYADEALQTVGEAGKPGNRLAEEKAAAAVLNLQQILVYPGRDGHLQDDVDAIIRPLAEDAIKDGIDVLVGNALIDHPDHQAAGMIAIKAARLAAGLGYPMDVLLLHHYDEGEHWAEATPDSTRRTFLAAKEHGSQWRSQNGTYQDWPAVPGDFSMHSEDLASLEPYPLRRNASYTHLSTEALIMPAAHEVIRYTNT